MLNFGLSKFQNFRHTMQKQWLKTKNKYCNYLLVNTCIVNKKVQKINFTRLNGLTNRIDSMYCHVSQGAKAILTNVYEHILGKRTGSGFTNRQQMRQRNALAYCCRTVCDRAQKFYEFVTSNWNWKLRKREGKEFLRPHRSVLICQKYYQTFF